MKKALDYIVKNITGSKDYKIVEEKGTEDNKSDSYSQFIIKAPKEIIGLIIGKKGKTIRMIRNLLRVKATLENKGVSVSVEEA